MKVHFQHLNSSKLHICIFVCFSKILNTEKLIVDFEIMIIHQEEEVRGLLGDCVVCLDNY